MSTTDNAVEVSHLTRQFTTHIKEPGFTGALKGLFKRQYQTKIAVSDLNFTLKKGEIADLPGPTQSPFDSEQCRRQILVGQQNCLSLGAQIVDIEFVAAVFNENPGSPRTEFAFVLHTSHFNHFPDIRINLAWFVQHQVAIQIESAHRNGHDIDIQPDFVNDALHLSQNPLSRITITGEQIISLSKERKERLDGELDATGNATLIAKPTFATDRSDIHMNAAMVTESPHAFDTTSVLVLE